MLAMFYYRPGNEYRYPIYAVDVTAIVIVNYAAEFYRVSGFRLIEQR